MEKLIIIKSKLGITTFFDNSVVGNFVQALIDVAKVDQLEINISNKESERGKVNRLKIEDRPVQEKKETIKKGQDSATDKVLNAMQNIKKSEAKRMKQVAEISGVKRKNIGETMTRLFYTGRIRRIGKPYRYYMIEDEESKEEFGTDPDKVFCKAKGRETYIEECVPNKNHPDCKDCGMLNQ